MLGTKPRSPTKAISSLSEPSLQSQQDVTHAGDKVPVCDTLICDIGTASDLATLRTPLEEPMQLRLRGTDIGQWLTVSHKATT